MPETTVTVVYRGENGDGWVPKSQRDLWNYGVRTGQIVVPPASDDGGEWDDAPIAPGAKVGVWVPPEYAGRLTKIEGPPAPSYFDLGPETGGDE